MTTKYTCQKCGKIFNRRTGYDRHKAKKFECGNKDIKCAICGREFLHRSSLYRHEKGCGAVTNIVNNQTTVNAPIYNNLNIGIDSMKVIKFGNENLSYISDDLYKQILSRGIRSIEQFIEHSHFNRKHPENHNIYIANIKDEYLVLYDGDKWAITKRDEKLEDIIYAKSDFLCEKFKQLSREMSARDAKKFENFILMRDDAKTMDRIKNDLTLQLYNNRKLPIKMRREMDMQESILSKYKFDVSLKDIDLPKLNKLLGDIPKEGIEEVQKLISSYKENKAYHFLPNR
jgi:hypothetical protein